MLLNLEDFIVVFRALLLLLLKLEDKWFSILKLDLLWLLSSDRKSYLQSNYILLDVIGWSKRKDMGYDEPGIKSCVLVSAICWLWPIYRSHKFVAWVHRILFIYGKLQSSWESYIFLLLQKPAFLLPAGYLFCLG